MTLDEFRSARYAGKEIEFFGEREYLNFYETISAFFRIAYPVGRSIPGLPIFEP
jgi:hypothetical protein